VEKQIPDYLKLAADTITEAAPVVGEDLSAIQRVCEAFEHVAGWQLEFADGDSAPTKSSLMWSAPVNPGVGNSPGHIRLFSVEQAEQPTAPLESAAALAEAIGVLWAELITTRRALVAREAELAGGVPLVVRSADPAPTLSDRLATVLRGGAEAVGCQAAGLYVLDAATTELKLRASWGLPAKRLTEPARPLRGALGDLEALLGHAVVLIDAAMNDYWKVPEQGFGSCVCVPVSSPTMPLGTLWAYCDKPREYSDAQTNILEVVAGRLAADLERHVLVGEALTTRDQSRQVAAVARTQHDQLARRAPMIEGWEIAANAYHAGQVGGTFFDWFARRDGGLSLVAGDARTAGLEGTMIATALRSAARAMADHEHEPHRSLETAGNVLWSGSAGDAQAGAFHAIVEPGAASLKFASAGPMRVLSIGESGCKVLEVPSEPLGASDTVELATRRPKVRVGDLVVAYGTTFMSDADEALLAAFDQRLGVSLEPHLRLSARKLAQIAGEILEGYPTLEARDRVLVVMKRTGR